MQRFLMAELVAWKNKPNRLPLILRGARQVGKTWLMKEFGARHFAKVAYVNFDRNERMQTLFRGDLSVTRILLGLELEANLTIDPADTLLIFDEIQECPTAVGALKYFTEQRPEYTIVAAGSLLGVALHPGTSFPVGKVEFMNLYPLSFSEFLDAMGNASLLALLRAGDFEMLSVFHSKMTELLKQYYFVGGMPEAVSRYLVAGDLHAAREVQTRLLNDYEQDFFKHAPVAQVPRLRMVWDSIPAQLAKENRKFVYGAVRTGARAKDFESAIQWLVDCGLCHRVSRVTKGGIPLKSYQDFQAFKLYLSDVGLLGAMAGIEPRTVLEGDAVFREFKGVMTEQYVCQQLIADGRVTPYYWSADASSGELDFVVQHAGRVLPIEVKAEENLRAKSLKSFCDRYGILPGIRVSMSGYRRQDWMLNIPLYAAGELLRVGLEY